MMITAQAICNNLPDWDGTIDHDKYIYVTFINGHEKAEGRSSSDWWCDTPEEAVKTTYANFDRKGRGDMWREQPNMITSTEDGKTLYAIKMRIAVAK